MYLSKYKNTNMNKFKLLHLITLFTFTISSSYAHINNINNISLQQNNNDIIAEINKNTTENQFTELVAYFEENDIELNLNKIDYNGNNEITSIQISLKKDGKNSNYSLSSNTPIPNISLGYKNNNLFITSSTDNNSRSTSINDLMEQFMGKQPIDSLLTANPFSFNFSSTDIQDFLNNDSFDFNSLADQILRQVNGVNNASVSTKNNSSLPKYNFINTPNLNKVIIIDGKESDFKTLNKLAKADKLNDVDNLKGTVAVSLYGKKAKDGAIIATTKK